MFIEHEAGELASISERGQVPAGSQKIGNKWTLVMVQVLE